MEIKLRKFQAGGPVDQAAPADQGGQAPSGADQGAPAPDQGGEQQGGKDPVMQIAKVAAQALQNKDCQAAMAVCQAFLQMLQQGDQGGQEQAAPQGEPVYRAGGKLVRRK